MKLKPILIESNDYSDIQLGITGGLHLEDGTAFALKKYQHVIIVDTEAEIIEGDIQYQENGGDGIPILRITVSKEIMEAKGLYNPKYSNTDFYPIDSTDFNDKVISSTNKSHNLPQLSPQSIQLLINYYNEYKELPESVSVEYEK